MCLLTTTWITSCSLTLTFPSLPRRKFSPPIFTKAENLHRNMFLRISSRTARQKIVSKQYVPREADNSRPRGRSGRALFWSSSDWADIVEGALVSDAGRDGQVVVVVAPACSAPSGSASLVVVEVFFVATPVLTVVSLSREYSVYFFNKNTFWEVILCARCKKPNIPRRWIINQQIWLVKDMSRTDGRTWLH